ncbi:uncharacterized Rho GTPase-activating protein At5g61530 isoform X1 [Amborella trichopoda]|uniref:Rho-GAP domain-containing protein n=1 Tax=Amborella trichopoda TaxID=13333 RepID=W1NZR7_AMBTC|nr:uncharacterized Rho GTPase-activating protein At5g61530 isoform X1 [Amborella trichopoda]XP_020519310.1 uncharacterized Rho GTPase-activating protein At5g61530 isoform X1 [Amborella trichopoda]ERN00175.1 hypothetical protein AMTR_s00111p00070830 [Amborella trichopoda]|eukprot:XP_006837321.1 uncharacterized Rho GTPase-activating protein At5g61530 isoform X1 [Amborella trichopoda]
MSSTVPPQWREKATDFFSSSGFKLKQAGQSAGSFAKDASGNVVDVAEKVGSLVKKRWSLIQQSRQQQAPRESVQERLIFAAASTSTLLKKGFSETKDKVAIGKTKVEEVLSETKDKVSIGKTKVEEAAKKTASKSKNILTNLERWQKGVASDDVFGVPLEVTVQRQQSSRPIPEVLVTCADYLILSGLHTEYLFKAEGDRKVIQNLISLYNQDWHAALPEGVRPVDVAALMKFYLMSLPEPLTTFALYHKIKNARVSVQDMRNALKMLPNASYSTLEFVTALLLRVSKKSSLNKMDSRSLAIEMAPAIICQEGDWRRQPIGGNGETSSILGVPFKLNRSSSLRDQPPYDAWDDLSDDGDNESLDASSSIPLDDGIPTDFGAIEVVQCLIENHNAVFTDANETIWK